MGKTKAQTVPKGTPTDRTAKSRNDRCVQGTNDSSVVSKCSMCAAGYFQDDFLRHFVAKQSRRAPLIHRGYFVRAAAVQKAFDAFLNEEAVKDDFDEGCSSGTKNPVLSQPPTIHDATPWLSTASAEVPRRRQIISLGAGFDASYFRLRHRGQIGADVVFIEIDFLPLCQRKAALIRNSPELCEVLGWNHDLGGVVMDDTDPSPDDKSEATKSTDNRAPEIVIDTPTYKLLGVDLSNIPLLDACLARYVSLTQGYES